MPRRDPVDYCTGKVAHPTRREADDHAQRLHRHAPDGRPVESYRCPCGAWHVGHSRGSRGAKRRAADRRRRIQAARLAELAAEGHAHA